MDNSELKLGELHPSAHDALNWLKEYQLGNINRWMIMRESIASSAISGNRIAEVMQGTLDRLDKGKPVSDRYLLGLCWFLSKSERYKEVPAPFESLSEKTIYCRHCKNPIKFAKFKSSYENPPSANP